MLPKWSRGRLRYHDNDRQILCDVQQPARSLCYSIYRQALNVSKCSGIIDEFNLDNVCFNTTLSKELSEYAKKGGFSVSEHWRCLVDIHKLGDFLEYVPDEQFIEDIKYWVNKDRIHTWFGDKDKFEKKFEESLTEICFEGGVSPARDYSIDEFILNSDMWATSGSGYEPEVGKLSVLDTRLNEEIQVKKNKWSVRWLEDSYSLKKLMFRKRKQLCKAVQKSETGKVRAVIGSDMSLYLKMTYISLFLDQIFSKRKDTTLYMTKRDRLDFWQKFAHDGTYRMPLDQSEFDMGVNSSMIKSVMKVLKKVLLHFYHGDHKEQVIEIMDLITYAVDGGVVVIAGQKIPITNGVLSGWRWTAMIDTLVNLAQVRTAVKMCKEFGHDLKIVDLCAQGDDDWLKLKTYRDCVLLWLCYEVFEFQVNPGKFFVDQNRDEFLRRVYEKGTITGYPARSVTSIMFRNPLASRESQGQSKIREGCTRWKLFSERLGVDFDGSWFFRSWIKDSMGAVEGLERVHIINFFKMDPVQGGMGWNGGVIIDSLIPGQSERITDNIKIDSAGFKEWSAFAAEYGVSEQSAIRFAASTLDLPLRPRMPPWVKYIYTYDKLNTVTEHGTEKRKASVAVGQGTRDYARSARIKWYPSLTRLLNTSHFTEAGLLQPEFFETQYVSNFLRWDHNPLQVREGISRTLAQLSEVPDLVYKDAYSDQVKHKPKRWQRDFYSGRLSVPTPLIAGVGTDQVGAIATSYLNNAINSFLKIRNPSMNLWKNFMRKINYQTIQLLKSLPIRVIE